MNIGTIIRVAMVTLLLAGSVSCATFGVLFYKQHTLMSFMLFGLALFGFADAYVSWILTGVSDED